MLPIDSAPFLKSNAGIDDVSKKYSEYKSTHGNVVKQLDWTPDNVGKFEVYDYGSIYWTPTTGAHEVHGAIRDKWASMGYERSLLGYPVTDEMKTPDGIGRFNAFQYGSIYWTPTTGAHEVHGDIKNKWAVFGYETSFLGYPTTDETGAKDGNGRLNEFQNGSIYWTSITGAHEIHGTIREKWASMGYEGSSLGYPISDELFTENNTKKYNVFQNGSIYFTISDGFVEVLPTGPLELGPWESKIIFDNGVPVGGWTNLKLNSNGSYAFSGHLHDSGAPSYNVSVIWTILSRSSHMFVFGNSGKVHGLEPGSRNHDWDIQNNDQKIMDNWGDLVGSNKINRHASANINLADLIENAKKAYDVISTVVEVITIIL